MAEKPKDKQPEKPDTPKPPELCSCGIERDRARSLCTEADCPFK